MGGMMSIERIREMESGWQRAPELLETEQEKFKPCFVTKPEPVTTQEGSSARFCCRVTGYPKPRVMWLINGHTVINGSRHKLIYDGMWHLDIPKCRESDSGKIEVIARNQVGEAYATTSLTVEERKDDYRSVLKHNVKRDFINSSEYRKPEWLTKMEEIQARLAATEQAPKFIREAKEVRIKEGMRAKFEALFAGNPKPEITWYFKGDLLKNSKNVQIKVRDDRTTLTLIDCGFDMAGHYECKAASDLGQDKTRASLTVNKLTEAERVTYEKQKKEGIAELVDDEEDKLIEQKKKKDEKKEKLDAAKTKAKEMKVEPKSWKEKQEERKKELEAQAEAKKVAMKEAEDKKKAAQKAWKEKQDEKKKQAAEEAKAREEAAAAKKEQDKTPAWKKSKQEVKVPEKKEEPKPEPIKLKKPKQGDKPKEDDKETVSLKPHFERELASENQIKPVKLEKTPKKSEEKISEAPKVPSDQSSKDDTKDDLHAIEPKNKTIKQKQASESQSQKKEETHKD